MTLRDVRRPIITCVLYALIQGSQGGWLQTWQSVAVQVAQHVLQQKENGVQTPFSNSGTQQSTLLAAVQRQNEAIQQHESWKRREEQEE